MTIYDDINELLEDKTLDAAQVSGIAWGPSLGFRVVMDDGSKKRISEKDYQLLDDNLEAMHEAWRQMRKRNR
jgi:hypothetical protein